MGKTYSNWARSVKFKPQKVWVPANLEELKCLVKNQAKAGINIRVVGSGHSFSPLIETHENLVSLDKIQGIVKIDSRINEAEIFAGTKLHDLGNLLHKSGLAMENLGDIDAQSLAGAISTGTHGTGIDFGNMSTQIKELTILTAGGEEIVCSEEINGDLFNAARISLGALGVITKIKVKLVPSFKLEFIQRKEKLDSCLTNIDQYNKENRNFEFYYFPHTDLVQTKFVNITDNEIPKNNISDYINDLVLENGVFKVVSEFARLFPSKSKNVSKLCAWAISPAKKINWSHKIFAVPRLVKFNEMEYAIPQQKFKDTLMEIDQEIKKGNHEVHFPIECRFVKADNIWLSPANERESAYISVHMYKGMEFKKYFDAMEAIFKNNGGRPHWGKMNSLSAKDFEKLYPHWNDFLRVRESLDPKGIFLNNYLKKIFGI